MVEPVLRGIPVVDVKLDDEYQATLHPMFSSKDFMTRIFGSLTNTTTSSQEYQQAITTFGQSAARKDTREKTPKFLLRGNQEFGFTPGVQGSVSPTSILPPLILLHNAMILRPKRLELPTVLQRSVTLTGVAGSPDTTQYLSGAIRNPDAPDSGNFTWNYSTMAFEATGGGYLEVGTVNGKERWISRQAVDAKLIPLDQDSLDKVNKPPDEQENTAEVRELLRRKFAPVVGKIRTSIRSVFDLRKNQPFFVRCRLHPMPQKARDYAKSVLIDNQDFSEFYPDQLSQYTSVELEWGGGATGVSSSGCGHHFKLIIRGSPSNGLSLYRKTSKGWTQVGPSYDLPPGARSLGEAHDNDLIGLSVYPLGRNLIVMSGVPSTESTIKGRYVVWSFDEFINIGDPSTKLNVHFYGGKTEFQFNPIIHVGTADLVSPPIGVGFDPNASGAVEAGKHFLKVDYEGKFSQDYVGSVSSTSTVALPLPTPEDMAGGCDSMGSKEKEKGSSKSKNKKKRPFFKYLEDFVEIAKKTILNNQGAEDEDEKVLYKTNRNSGTTGGVQFKYVITLRSEVEESPDSGGGSAKAFGKGGKTSVPKGSEDKTKGSQGPFPPKRIYSPAIYKAELFVIPPIIGIPMRPDPQIDNADVKMVEVTQNVQDLSASVTLWNREPCRRGQKQSRGPYSFHLKRKGSNFTGVKPITIRGGISTGNQGFASIAAGQIAAGASLGAAGAVAALVRARDLIAQALGAQQPIQMKGFVSNRSYSRPSTAESYVTLEIEDYSKPAREQFAVNLPIFDGWCNLAVFYTLCKEAGYLDDQILFYQNPRNPDDKITIRQVMESAGTNVDARQGGCFAGHVPKFPPSTGPAARVTNLPPSTIHALMPLNAYREQPNYMFQMGRALWECMQEVREFTGFFLYPNIHGNLIYSPAEVSLKQTSKGASGAQPGPPPGGGSFSLVPASGGGGAASETPASGGGSDWEFFEVSGGSGGNAVSPGAYNQYQSHLDVPYGTEHVRNAVMTMSFITSNSDPGNALKYRPITIIKKQPEWPFNVDDPSYVPWLRWLIARSPHWNDKARLQANTNQRFLRGIQPRTTPTFGAWGHAALYPYDLITLHEQELNETGIDGIQVICQSVTKTFDGHQKAFTMEVASEYINFDIFEWSPHENQAGPAQRVLA